MRQVGGLVVRQALRVVALGISIGLVAALLLTRSLRSLLFGVSPGNPWILAAVSAALLAIALLASWVPARRAAHVDPLDALRRE
jgi:ABC-type antimicrobial peptide transport system permease subunit